MSVRVKICGVTQPEQAREIERLGAEYLGVVFAKSKRRVSTDVAKRIRDAAPNVQLVGVFVNERISTICEIALDVGLDAVQLHGDEEPDVIEDLSDVAEIIKAVPVDRALSPDDEAIAAWPEILLDTPDSKLRGGVGRRFDIELATALAGIARPRLFVAGGLDPDNVAEVVRRLRPFAVDVSSGVESAPGVKDMAAVANFIRNAKAVK
ncbi:MAG: phosphoribosylanthranilate isomerase [Deltaproteobacteria bacterium]|nr:phosphoribosylanthranilate isomerase [Deltaproteobacteria bacterium]